MENLIELKSEELVDTNGGDFGLSILVGVAIGVTVAAAAEIFDDWGNFKAGLDGRPPVQAK